MKYLNNPKAYSIIALMLFSIMATSQEIEKSIYITANTGLSQDNEVLSAITKEVENVKNSMLLILGNSSPSGKYKKNISEQLYTIKSLKKDVIFIPGNQEWSNLGYKGLRDIENYIQKKSKAKFYPDNGVSIKHIDLSDNVVLITLDSQWFLENWDKHPYINENSEIQNRSLFFLEFENRVKKAQGKIILVALHHPIQTNTKQGLIANVGGTAQQDFQNKQYRKLRKRLTTIARGTENIIFLSGHDQNLQYINHHNVPQIISGSATKLKNVKKVTDNNFGSATRGFARLDIATNGTVSVHFFSTKNNSNKPLFNTIIWKGTSINSSDFTFNNKDFSVSQKASIYTKEQTDKSAFYKTLWGNHYREYYSKSVQAPTVLLDTLKGGLTPLKRGGGQQSKSLRLEDSQGRQYVMRALKKSTIKFLQSNAFPDAYIGDALDGTVVDKFLADFYTTSHPYTPFAIDRLSDAVNINHTNPQLFYIPKQKTLGIYNTDFGDELYMIEEHVGDTQLHLESFGKPKKILSTADVLQEINKSGKSVVDEPSYIRARIFDMLIGDWDRHEDQWRWALFKNKNGTETCKPIPRDRDQAFSKYDGTLIRFLTRAIPSLRKMQTYDYDLRNAKWFASSPYHLDLTLINSSNWDEWKKQTEYIQNNLTDEEIERAFNNIPEEIKGKTIGDIKQKLKGRRGNLMQIVKDYYRYFSKFEVITGTQKDDTFEITRLPDGKTTIKINRKDLGILNRTFNSDITKEIWIYGLDGQDSFLVQGKGNKLIKIKIVGGKKNDTYNFKNRKNVKLYDYASKKNTILQKNSKKWLVDDYAINNYDHKKVKHSFNQLLPLIAINPDDGLKVGILHNHTFYGLQRNKFTQKHSINAAYYTSTSGFDLSYKGEFANIFHKWNFGIEGLYTSPNFSTNFFGFGNETYYDKDAVDLDFNRIRIRKWKAAISLNWRGENGGHFQFKPLLESFKVENTITRFITSISNNSTIFEQQTYAGAEISYNFKNKDNPAFPTLGLDAGLTGGYKSNIGSTSAENSFAYLKPQINIDHKLTKSGSLVLATKLSAEFILGDDYEFYHATTIGGNNGLRGFRNERFTGKNSFYQNTDLRIPLGGLKTSVIPLRFGITGSFDYGRVWLDNNTSNKWHNSAGGSIWLNAVNALSANVGYFNSTDGGRVVFTLGFAF